MELILTARGQTSLVFYKHDEHIGHFMKEVNLLTTVFDDQCFLNPLNIANMRNTISEY